MERTLDAGRLATLLGSFDRSPAYRGLYLALQELIGDGRIPIGTRLPSERAVAAALGLSRITVARAYADLAEAGFAQARQGSGTYAAVPIDRRRAHDHALRPLLDGDAIEGAIDLNCAATAASPGLAAAYERALAALPAYLGGDGYLPSGLPALRARIAASYAERGLPTSTEQIVITSGALSALAILARALSGPGDRIMIESPVYPNAMEALKAGGGRLVASPLADPLGEEGWDHEGIEATLRQASPRLAYLIPDFQNPTGFLMDEAGRERYARSLHAAGTTAIIDETLQPISLDGTPMPAPFTAFAKDALSVGSVSKLYWGGLRVGWIRAPRDLVPRIVAARVRLDLGGSLFDQLVVLDLMDQPELLPRRREDLRRQRDALAAAVDEYLPDWRYRLPGGGLSLWLRMPAGSATRYAARMERHGVLLAPGPVFSVEGGADRWLRLPYARREAELVLAVQRMAEAWAGGQEQRAGERAVPVLIA